MICLHLIYNYTQNSMHTIVKELRTAYWLLLYVFASFVMMTRSLCKKIVDYILAFVICLHLIYDYTQNSMHTIVKELRTAYWLLLYVFASFVMMTRSLCKKLVDYILAFVICRHLIYNYTENSMHTIVKELRTAY